MILILATVVLGSTQLFAQDNNYDKVLNSAVLTQKQVNINELNENVRMESIRKMEAKAMQGGLQQMEAKT